MAERRTSGDILMKGVKDKLRNARTLAPSVPYELHHFCDYLAEVSNDEIVPMGMMILLTCALEDLKQEKCGFAVKTEFPKVLAEEKYQVFLYLKWFPVIVDSFGDDKFSEEFRTLFEEFIGKPQPRVGKATVEYEVIVDSDGRIDISHKDKAEVLAALYNGSHPHGMGFLQYNAKPMTVEEAREILAETMDFDYLYGRVMKISLRSNLINVFGYDRDNGQGAAKRAISTCPNIS